MQDDVILQPFSLSSFGWLPLIYIRCFLLLFTLRVRMLIAELISTVRARNDFVMKNESYSKGVRGYRERIHCYFFSLHSIDAKMKQKLKWQNRQAGIIH